MAAYTCFVVSYLLCFCPDASCVWEAIALRMHAAMKELEDQSPPNLSQRKLSKDQSSAGLDQSS
eukprot:540436-Pelagomonas_calceolata.AAC.2